MKNKVKCFIANFFILYFTGFISEQETEYRRKASQPGNLGEHFK